MDKKRKWQLFLILGVIALTVYNILPTLFYYLKPLHQPIDSAKAVTIAHSIEERVNQLESDGEAWLASFCELLHTKPSSIQLDPNNPQLISLQFTKSEDAARFRKYLNRAGSLIPFTPSQFMLPPQEETGKEVWVQRNVPLHLDSEKSPFVFSPKKEGEVS